MNNFYKKYFNIGKTIGLPILYKYLYLYKFKKSDGSTNNVRVDAYNSSSFPPDGHYKPISKIIDLKNFDKKNDE